MKKKNRIIGILLSLMLVLGLMPSMAYADPVDYPDAYSSNGGFTVGKKIVTKDGSAVPQATTFYYKLTSLEGNKTPEDFGIHFYQDSDVADGVIPISTNGKDNDTLRTLPFYIDGSKIADGTWGTPDDGPTPSYSCAFKLTEIVGKDKGWTYDPNVYNVMFAYYLNENGTARAEATAYLSTDITITPVTPVFTNTYNYKPTTAVFSIDIDKTVEQGGTAAPGKEDFTFLLRDENGKTPADYDITITSDKISTDGKGTFKGNLTGEFSVNSNFSGWDKWEMQNSEIEYRCTFYLTEQNDGKDGWKYSDKEYLVEITYDPDTMTASAVVTLPEAEVSYSTDALSSVAAFTNTYTKAAKSPETGDDSNMGLWIALMLAAVLCAGGTVLYSRRSRSER